MIRTLIYKIRGEVVTLIEGQENNKTEKIVPIWGEEIIVVKEEGKIRRNCNSKEKNY